MSIRKTQIATFVLLIMVFILSSCTNNEENNPVTPTPPAPPAPPKTTITTDIANPSVGQLVTLTCTKTNNVGNASYSFSSNPKTGLTPIGSNQVSLTANTTAITVTCTDTDAATTQTAAITVVVATKLLVTSATTASYSVSIELHWTPQSHASQPSFPSSDHFTTMPFIRHNSNVVYWRSGIMASGQLEPLAELGGTSALVNLANRDNNTDGVVTASLPFNGVASKTLELIVHKDYPLITSATMIAPSPDWFTGVRNLSLIDAENTDPYWLPSVAVSLLGYDAGTEDGISFSLSNPPSNPKQLIHLLSEDSALLAAGFNIAEPFGTITFSLQSVVVDATDTAAWSTWSQWSPANNADISVMTINQARTRNCSVTVNGSSDSPAPTCSGCSSETRTQPIVADTAACNTGANGRTATDTSKQKL